ncbi:MAG: hypothetical protein KDK34_22695 [Leptospiraceae bacterium]|nr:hypothetical protein [Leptospiraceae bacterium]
MSSNRKKTRRYSFVFVCQRGELEGMALLLAASLKRYLRCDYELIAAVPTPESRFGTLRPLTRRILDKMQVRVETIYNPIKGDLKGDLLTNKIHCFGLPFNGDKVVFLDSDILCLREFHDEARFDAPFNAAPTFRATGRNWEQVYAAVGMEVPSDWMLTLFSNEWQPPYFNSGFAAIDANLAADLKNSWLECFERITATGAMSDNLYYREQVSMAVAVMKMGIKYDVLEEQYNFWVKARPFDPENPPIFLHHTYPHPPIYNQPLLKDTVRSLVREYPGLDTLLEDCRWKYYLKSDFVVALYRSRFELKRKLKNFRKPFKRAQRMVLEALQS